MTPNDVPEPLTAHPGGYHPSFEPDDTLTTTGLERAADLVANFLHNEDGESDAWLEEAHDLIRAELAAHPESRPDPGEENRPEPIDEERLRAAYLTAFYPSDGPRPPDSAIDAYISALARAYRTEPGETKP